MQSLESSLGRATDEWNELKNGSTEDVFEYIISYPSDILTETGSDC